MIRINLLGQPRPRRAGASALALRLAAMGGLAVGLCVSLAYLGIAYRHAETDLQQIRAHVRALQTEQAQLREVAATVSGLQRRQAELQHHLDAVKQLAGGPSITVGLLAAIADSVDRTDDLWLTSVESKGADISLQGEGASINAVANFMTALRLCGYFSNVEIKQTAEDDSNPAAVAYSFQMTAKINPLVSGSTTGAGKS